LSTQALIASGGILFGLMLITALLVRRGGVRRGNRMLAASLACTLAYLLALIIIREEWERGRFLGPLLAASYLLSPALLLGYVRALLNTGRSLEIRDALHVLPALCFLLLILGHSINGSTIGNDAMEQARGGWPPNLISSAGILMYMVQIVYFSRALFELQAHRRRVPTQFSYEEQVTLRWLRVLVGISLLLSLVGLTIALIRLIPGIELWPRSIYSMTAVLLIYYLIGFMGMSQPAIFTVDDSPLPASAVDPVSLDNNYRNNNYRNNNNDNDNADKYGTSALTAEATAAYWRSIQTLMESEQPFLDNRLRIADLAARLDMPVHHLSQTINHCARQSFFEFINGYRVETAKQLLSAGEKPVSHITLDAGFNSDSVFYRHFKKVTGMTPKQYQRRGTPTSTS
jgi:AraC-like DNA-binding protein